MIQIKTIVAILFLNISLIGIAKNISSTQTVVDTIYSLDYVYSIAGRKNSPAKFIIDSLNLRGIASGYSEIPKYKILLAQAYVASRELRPNVAIYFVNKSLSFKELHENDSDYIMATSLLSNEYYVLNRIDESVKYSLLSIKRAKQAKRDKDYAVGKLNLWTINTKVNDSRQAIKEVREARKILRNNSKLSDSLKVIWSFEVEASIYISTGKYKPAISLYEQILSIYNSLPANDNLITDTDRHYKIGQTHITLAMLNARISEYEIAKKHYQLWKEAHKDIPLVLSGQLYYTVVEYMKLAGLYEEALEYSLHYQNIAFEGDSINKFTVIIKQELSSIYKHLNDYKQAWAYEHQASAISDSLYARANNSVAIEIATIYRTEENQSKINEQQIIISRNRVYMFSISIIAIAIIIIALIVWINSKKIARKNIALFNQIKILSDVQNKRVTESDNNNEKDLFARLEKYMVDEQIFLKTDIVRESVAAELGTNKIYLSKAIREKTNLTFSEYVNALKLEYAKDLLLNNSEIKIEGVSIMSGFNSVRTFYRLFQKKYNLTPTEFKSLASKEKME